jgi:hypothetical protein
MSDNPMGKAHDAPRCAAKSKRSGQPCRGPAVKGWRVCAAARPRASGMGIIAMAARTKEAIELRRLIRALGGKSR